jgi:hypothetical protein
MQPSNIFIEGYFARLMYRSLYKDARICLAWRRQGFPRRGLSRAEPQVKLH